MIKAPLSDIATEQVRDLRARLNRLPKGALGDKSVGPLSKGFFDVCARAGLAVLAENPTLDVTAPGVLLEAAETGDMAVLQNLVAALHTLRNSNPSGWRWWVDQGYLQAILRRRLVLAGRLPASQE